MLQYLYALCRSRREIDINFFGIPGIFSEPEIHGGQPVVNAGVPLYLILDMLAQGLPQDEMLQDYGITAEHIHIALRYAAEHLKQARPHAA